MKKLRIIPIIICISMLLSFSAYAAVLGEQIDTGSVMLAEGAILTEAKFWTGKDYREEHVLTLVPGSAAVPVAVSGERLWSRQSIAAAAAELEQRGFHAVGGVNGGFFTIASGEPVGLVAANGSLRTDDEGLQAVGFCTDGDVLFGDPEIRLTIWNGEESMPVASLNRVQREGLQLFTSDCASGIYVDETSWGILCAVDGEIKFSGNTNLRVEQVLEMEQETVHIPEGKILLLQKKQVTADSESETTQVPFAEKEELQLQTACADGWETVDSAVGILYPVLKDGEVLPGLETYAAPRTAIGLKADGSIVLYTLDGRQNGYSVGAGLSAVAERMKELGCVLAGALDGGGSTQLSAVMPGEDELTVINRPSDGSARSVVNYIIAATPDEAPRGAELLALYPLQINAVSGAEIPLTVSAIDRNGRAAEVPANISYTISGNVGHVRDGVFYADGTGTGTISVSAPGARSAEIPVYVADTPEKLEIYGEVYGKLTTSLRLEPGQEVDLTVRATDHHVILSGDDSCFVWTLEPAAGTVDGTGHLIPADASGTGMLSVSAGERCIAIPITIWSGIPFEDVARSDAYFNAVKYVYDNKIFKGTSDTSFEPYAIMNRAMLVTVLWRMCGEPAAAASAGFADVEEDSWYGPAVAWAQETGLILGYNKECFGPLDDLTMEQIMTVLHRWAGEPDTEENRTAPEGASEYAVAALRWAMDNNLIGTQSLQPQSPTNRAVVAEILMRWDKLTEE